MAIRITLLVDITRKCHKCIDYILFDPVVQPNATDQMNPKISN